MQIEENKTVDLPDENSGPATEIDITDPSTESENIKQETESNDNETVEVVKEEIKTEEKKEEPKKDELEEYSEGVQRRIAKLTKKWREAERQKDEALTYAERMILAKKEADSRISKLEPGFMKSTEESIVSGLESAKAKLAAAREAGDITAEVEAQTAISELAYKQARFNESKVELEDRAKRKEIELKLLKSI